LNKRNTKENLLFLREIGLTSIAIFLAFAIGSLIIWATGYSVIGVYRNILAGAFWGRYAIGQTLTQTTPIIFTSLSFLIAFRCGLFNIGAEGQLYIGAFAAAWVGFSLHLPVVIHVIVALLAGAIAGAFWGFIPGLLKAFRGANEFVTTLMLSYIANLFTSWLVSPNGPYHGSQWANQTVRIAKTAELPRILPPTQLSMGIILAILMVLLIWYILFRTPIGYEIRSVGANPEAAEYGGINVKKTQIWALTLAGLLAGLGGACEILGTHRRFIDGFSPGYGWDGIAGGLIARSHPIAVIFAAFLIGALRAGGMRVDRAGAAPYDIVAVLQGLVIFFVIAPSFIRYIIWKNK
jgi:simple sugar transport system permease protein